MTKTYTLKQYKQGKIAINTRTQEEYDSLMRFFESIGIKWGSGDNATDFKHFETFNKETTIRIKQGNTSLEHLSFWGKHHPDLGYKIILPTDLVEYNEYMAKQTEGICVFSATTFLETQYLTIGQAIDYMLESEENVIEYVDSVGDWTVKRRIKDNKLQRFSKEGWIYNDYTLDMMTRCWKNIKKHIEPKTKTLKELLEAKEPFKYKNNWYRINKNGAILDKHGTAMGIDFVKEILTIIEESNES